MNRATLVFLMTGIFGLVLAMTVSLVPTLPSVLIAAGYGMMFTGTLGMVVISVLTRSLARTSVN